MENEIDFIFYFDKDWFSGCEITKSFKDASLTEVIDGLLDGTSINYIFLDKRIILTNNNAVFTELPIGYFGDTIKDEEEIKMPTAKQKQFEKRIVGSSGIVYSVGKENKRSSKKVFTVSGIIRDSKTGKPIESMTVFVAGIGANTLTGTDGFYTLNLPSGYYILELSSLSYGKDKKQIIVYGDGILNLNIQEVVEQLDEVLIESNRDDNIKKVAVGVTKIDVEGIKNIPLVLGERDILKVATTMPGIKTAGEGALGYSVRGGKVDQNLILFDNALLYNPSHFFGVFSAINPFVTDDVDIYKGSIPAEFGGRLSSVIDIKTKEANMKKFSGEGNIGPITGNLTFETPIVKDKISVMAGVRATYSDWILKAISEESVKNSSASFYDAVLKYDHKIDNKNTLQATGYMSRDEFSISSDSTYAYANQLASIKWGHQFNDKNRLSVRLANSNYKFNIINEGNFNRNFDYGFSINETQLKLLANYNHSKIHKFTYGIGSKLYNIQPGYIKPLGNESDIERKSLDKEKGLESAVFLSDLFSVNEKLQLDAGLRYSVYTALGESSQNIYNPDAPRSEESVIYTKFYKNNEVVKSYGGLELRLSGRYYLSSSMSLKLGYNNTIQYSHLLSTNTTASPVDSWKLSDLNIEPQRADQFSLGLFKNFKEDQYEASVEGYYKNMKNLLDFKVGANLTLNENIETELLSGDGKAYGVEFLIKKKKGRLNGWLGYSYSRTLVKLDSKFLTDKVNNGEYFPANQDRPHDLSLISNYRITKRYSVSFNFNYQSGRPVTYPVGKYYYSGNEQVLYSDRNKHRIPDYYRLDLGINIEGDHRNEKLAHSFWNVSIYNLLGRNNPYSVYFVNEKGRIKGYKSSIFSVPIPTITYNFKF
ncbi:TonB-dependent receptor [Snuella lapsa]|uniref:TonB-dependent receptor n=1 Tax=Snuella lapsa TaxID=870481 RepID=UPI0031E9DF88